jgi:DNA invertase Pin-like site-specific DNA recombinase
MNMLLNLESPVTTSHRAKLAYIYVRQSTAGQVRQHQESTELQYRLVDRAAAFGWPKERIEVIDDDLGKSGTSSDGRGGFQRLIAEIGLGKAGLVLSLDASRLARNNRDWHQLLELCSLFGVLIADGERLYDPCAYHDRLLLGLSGIMSEAELHQIKLRLHQGERQKAARGELRLPCRRVWHTAGIAGSVSIPTKRCRRGYITCLRSFASFAAPRRSCATSRKPTCCCRCGRSMDRHRTMLFGGRRAVPASFMF